MCSISGNPFATRIKNLICKFSRQAWVALATLKLSYNIKKNLIIEILFYLIFNIYHLLVHSVKYPQLQQMDPRLRDQSVLHKRYISNP